MKISELISKLQYAQHVSGDLEVIVIPELSWNTRMDEIFITDEVQDINKIKISTDSKRIEIITKNLPYISD